MPKRNFMIKKFDYKFMVNFKKIYVNMNLIFILMNRFLKNCDKILLKKYKKQV